LKLTKATLVGIDGLASTATTVAAKSSTVLNESVDDNTTTNNEDGPLAGDDELTTNPVAPELTDPELIDSACWPTLRILAELG
jgi:hypothetical protein